MGTKTIIRVTRTDQFFQLLTVKGRPLRLAIRSIGTADRRSLIPIQTQPLEVADNGILKLRLGPFPVRILDSKNEFTPRVPGKKPIEKRRSGSAYMKVAGRTWGKPHSNCCHYFQSSAFRLFLKTRVVFLPPILRQCYAMGVSTLTVQLFLI